MTKVITFASSKAGTGKATLCVNIAAYFAKQGQSVLVIDTDPQKSSYDWISKWVKSRYQFNESNVKKVDYYWFNIENKK